MPEKYNRRYFPPSQKLLLPVDMMDWLDDNDEVFIYHELLQNLDLSSFYKNYREDGTGGKFYDPIHLLGVIFYCYSNGIYSSRKIEEACRINVRCRYLAGNMSIDHSTIARFRQNNLDGIKDLFTQFLVILYEAQLIDPRLLALDGTKIKANASLSSNKTYNRLEKLAHSFVQKGQFADDEEKPVGVRESPREVATRKEMEERIKKARSIVEERHRAEVKQFEEKVHQREEEEKETGKAKRGRKPKQPPSAPEPSDKANITDPDSRIMKSRTGYLQGYNAQSISTRDGFVLGCSVTNEENDMHQLIPVLELIHDLAARFEVTPDEICLLADAGYFSYENMMAEYSSGIDLRLSPWREQKMKDISKDCMYPHELQRICWEHSTWVPCIAGSVAAWAEEHLKERGEWMTKETVAKQIMGAKLVTEAGKKLYGMRKYMIESIFGIIKENRKFRSFLTRGLEGVNCEWTLVNMVHNIKLGIKKGIGLFLNQRHLGGGTAIAGV